MKRLIAAAMSTVALAAACIAGAAPAHAAGPKILLTGDSLTQGYEPGDTTWRYYFDKGFVNAHDLVGSRCDVRLGSCQDYADPNFDRDHFAKSGTTYGVQHPLIDDEIRRVTPDWIYVSLGVNDLRAGGDTGRGPAYGATVVNRMEEWITSARAANPNAKIIVSSVVVVDPARDPGYPLNGTTTNSRINDFNRLAPARIAELSTTRSPIRWHPNHAVWTPTTMTRDGIHPNAAGERFLAEKARVAFDRVGIR